ncbi:MAG: sugar ABC transporter permease [Furfurilactobacillus sp.]|jgi:multiple sugar transport system permease protein|uniref:Sugar ABC transporterpermease n=3 Tax=Furfurilactobacillus TaxID=2767882 RepID=A0A0R1REH7_9LACO|nr:MULTISPECIES: sugar ABC transporter permease [Furfurilactobacillus]KRL52610.1 sugar ABC transporterpermease [Furfurilactobacillus rossiae DSM 15814]MCF6161346.1 sugar ABC transporter permease [Furfurilactobacillus milii]MCF6163726.1 sugar ABC transporter permease [Furfurilactobacillus milii]MCF6166785.1 sugar ABC transporter permease [Furfurilactobacillus rossiae]MCF6419596.1 sugar ABC transporter permease [Furfurilactobacillus milii]
MIKQHPTIKSTLIAFAYLAPMLIITLVFNIYPIFKSFAMSFYTKYDFFTDKVSALGWANYKFIFSDPDFYLSVRNTLIFVLGVVPFSVLLSLIIALLLHRVRFLAGLFKTAYFLPFVTSTVAISLVWQWIYNDQYGLLNAFLSHFGVHPIDWLNDPHWAMPALIIMTIWKGLGFNIILFLVGLSNIDKRYDQVAQIDGANAWQRFIHVTLPLLSPMTFLVSVTSVISGFKVFDEIFVLFGGSPGPGKSTLTIVFYLYQKFYSEWKYGIAAASGVVLFLLILVVTIIQFWYSRKHVHYA